MNQFLMFNCIRLHKFLDTHYQVLVTDKFIVIQKKSSKPKYNYELSLKSVLHFFVEGKQMKAFGIKYNGQVKLFQSSHADLCRLREQCRGRILFENILDFYTIQRVVQEDRLVYRVEDRLSLTYWTAKCIPKTEDFISQVEILRRVHHQALMRVRECFNGEHFDYIILEQVHGHTIREHLHKFGHMTHLECKSIMKQLIEALAHLEENKIVCRSIDTNTVMVSSKTRLEIKLIDYHKAVLSDAITHHPIHNLVDAPEVLKGNMHSFKSDVYMAGVLMYKLYTGLDLFIEDDVQDYHFRNRQGIVDIQYLHRNRTPLHAQELILAMLNPDPEQRPCASDALAFDYFLTTQLTTQERKSRFQKIAEKGIKSVSTALDEIDEEELHTALIPTLVVKPK